MLRSILIGLDGSTHSNAAINVGIRWARQLDALLIGLGIVDEPTIRRPEPVAIGGGQYKRERDEDLLANARRRIGRLLDGFGQRCESEGVKCRVLEDTGLPCSTIVHESRLCDLTLLGQKTHFHFEAQDWPDETLRKVLRQSSRPVVTVPEILPEESCVVVAYDGGPHADRALQAFQSLGLSRDREVHVVSVHNDIANATRLAEQAVDFLAQHQVKAVAHPLRPEMPVSAALLAQVDDLHAHLLVMGAYGGSAWKEFVFGSTTASVLEASQVPVFLCN